MVPLPATLFSAVAFPLQNLAARNAAWTLDTLGVPVLLDGNIIHLNQAEPGRCRSLQRHPLLDHSFQ